MSISLMRRDILSPACVLAHTLHSETHSSKFCLTNSHFAVVFLFPIVKFKIFITLFLFIKLLRE